MSYTYLTTERLAERIRYEPSTIRCSLKDSVLLEGIHYIRPFGRRKILYIWEKIEEEMLQGLNEDVLAIPLASGGYCNG